MPRGRWSASWGKRGASPSRRSLQRSATAMTRPTRIMSWGSESLFHTCFRENYKERPILPTTDRSESQPAIAAKICDRDDAPYEDNVLGFGKSFPHLLPGKLQGKANPAYYDLLTFTPYATEVLLDAALKGFVAESLGTRGVTDMICIGISATDELGHVFGPASHEVFDDALRTDSMLASFLAFLDQKVGLANCVIVLTSDHGISHIPEYIRSKSPRFEAGRVGLAEMTRQASKALDAAKRGLLLLMYSGM